MDYSDLVSGLNVGSAILAIMGAGALIIAVGFAGWLTDMIAGWFDSHDDSDEEDEQFVDVNGAERWGEDVVECLSCGWYPEDEDSFLHAVHQGYCPKCGE